MNASKALGEGGKGKASDSALGEIINSSKALGGGGKKGKGKTSGAKSSTKS